MSKSFKPITKKIVVTRGGRIDSGKLSAFFDQVTEDLLGVSRFVTEQSTSLDSVATTQKLSDNDLRQRVAQLAGELEELRLRAASAGERVVHRLSFYDSDKITFPTASTFATRVMVNTTFGEATVPINAAEPRFYQQAVNTAKLIPVEDLRVVVTGTFDADDGQGVVDHESGATKIEAGEPLYAFNGNNNYRWMRKVIYPLYDDTTEVLCELTVDLPEGSGMESNIITLIGAPIGDADILGVYTSPDLSNSFSIIDDFTEVEGVGAKRWIFPVRKIQRVKVRFRQRNWVEEDGSKVFYYGAEEIGMQLVEWDKTYSDLNPVEDNHSVVLYQDAPDGYAFRTIYSLTTDPMFSLEDPGSRHCHVKICDDADGTTVLWDSDSDALPQNVGGGWDLGATYTTLYFIVTLNYVATSGGVSSPWRVGTSPVVKSLSFHAYAEEI